MTETGSPLSFMVCGFVVAGLGCWIAIVIMAKLHRFQNNNQLAVVLLAYNRTVRLLEMLTKAKVGVETETEALELTKLMGATAAIIHETTSLLIRGDVDGGIVDLEDLRERADKLTALFAIEQTKQEEKQ